MREDILKAIRDSPPQDFVAEYLYDRIPFIFGDDRATFISWKHRLGEIIEVDPCSLSLVGSAALGVSLNPDKNFKVFDHLSDVDVAVISHYHFTVSWRFLRTNGHLRARLDPKSLVAWDDHVKRLIYWGTIATDKLLGILPFGKQWLGAVNAMARLDPTFGREVNLRIYADYESLRAYQIQSVRRARDELLGKER
jgi:hypothetical protein